MAHLHVEKLRKLVPPLEPPPENDVDWKIAEQIFGIDFPEDFKHFVKVYGNVMWCDMFRPIYPKTESIESCEQSKQYVLRTLSAMYGGAL